MKMPKIKFGNVRLSKLLDYDKSIQSKEGQPSNPMNIMQNAEMKLEFKQFKKGRNSMNPQSSLHGSKSIEALEEKKTLTRDSKNLIHSQQSTKRYTQVSP